jgi:hypothetical protein
MNVQRRTRLADESIREGAGAGHHGSPHDATDPEGDGLDPRLNWTFESAEESHAVVGPEEWDAGVTTEETVVPMGASIPHDIVRVGCDGQS